jgi:Fe-S cluster assembly iron-binding protein IscA
VLTLTTPAIEAIRTLTAQPGLPEDTGLRIVHEDSAGSISLSISPEPLAGDEIIETAGVRVFLQDDAAAMLADKALDATIGDDGIVFQIA